MAVGQWFSTQALGPEGEIWNSGPHPTRLRLDQQCWRLGPGTSGQRNYSPQNGETLNAILWNMPQKTNMQNHYFKGTENSKNPWGNNTLSNQIESIRRINISFRQWENWSWKGQWPRRDQGKEQNKIGTYIQVTASFLDGHLGCEAAALVSFETCLKLDHLTQEIKQHMSRCQNDPKLPYFTQIK